MKLHTLTLVVLVIVLVSSSLANAEQPAPSPPVTMTVTDAWRDGTRHTPPPDPDGTPKPDVMGADAGLHDRIWIEVDKLDQAVLHDKINPRDLVLYVKGQELTGIKAVAVEGPKQNWLGFDLLRTPESDPVWRRILGSPTSQYRQVSVSVGFHDKEQFATTSGKSQPVIYLRLYYGWWLLISLVGLVVMLALFYKLATRGNLIHDSDPPQPPAGKMKPYSLALTQAAWWFFFVIGSFVFIYMVTGDYNTISNQALILMGIGTGTALGAFMINATKSNTADADLNTLVPQRQKLAAEIGQTNDPVALAEKRSQLEVLDKKIEDARSGLAKPVSEGFFSDILTDVDGITLHRFQMVIWTVVLGAIFAVGVYQTLAMPEFSPTLLALMGISSLTYLGFKIPERQN